MTRGKCKSSRGQTRLWHWFVVANVFGLLATAVLLRAWRIDHIPGLNGDEAWIGVQALNWLDGTPVAWRTPTGNPMNVFHFLPQALLHALLPPSVPLLRFPVLVSGLLALPVNFFLSRRGFGQPIAVLSTVVLAVLPINIAYCRFAWDASQSLLFTLPVLYLPSIALREPQRRGRMLLLAIVAFAAAVIVHPTNVFTAPLIVIPAGFAYRHRLRQAICFLRYSRHRRFPIAFGVASFVLIVFCLRSWLGVAGGRVLTPGQYGLFLQHYVDLFSGTSIFRYIAGTGLDAASAIRSYRFLAFGMFVVAAVGGCQALRGWRRWKEKVVCLGAGTSLLAFFLIAGPEGIRPHYERYGICLIAAGALWLALAANWWLARFGRRAAIAGVIASWSLLGAFYGNYLDVFLRTGGQSHMTFRTGKVEPKLAAALRAVSLAKPDEPLRIVATQWWNYWPLKYFASETDRIEVIGLDHEPHRPETFSSGRGIDGRSPGGLCFVEFHDTDEARAVHGHLLALGRRIEVSSVSDYGGRPVLTIFRPRGSTRMNCDRLCRICE